MPPHIPEGSNVSKSQVPLPSSSALALNAHHTDDTIRSQALTMALRGRAQGVLATVLFDSGAVPNAVNAAFVKEHKLSVLSSACRQVLLADGTTAPVLGSTFVDVEVQGVRFPRVPCIVVDLALDWTVILG